MIGSSNIDVEIMSVNFVYFDICHMLIKLGSICGIFEKHESRITMFPRLAVLKVGNPKSEIIVSLHYSAAFAYICAPTFLRKTGSN